MIVYEMQRGVCDRSRSAAIHDLASRYWQHDFTTAKEGTEQGGEE